LKKELPLPECTVVLELQFAVFTCAKNDTMTSYSCKNPQ